MTKKKRLPTQPSFCLRLAHDAVLCEAAQKNQCGLQKKYRSARLEIHPDKTKILNNEKTNKLQEIGIDGTHVEIHHPEVKVKFLGQMITFMDQETTEVHAAQDPLCLVRVCQTLTRTDIPIILTTTQITLIRRLCHANNNVRCGNLDYNKRTRKHTRHYPAQNASSHHGMSEANKKKTEQTMNIIKTAVSQSRMIQRAKPRR